MDSQIQALAVQLTQVVLKNTAEGVATSVSALRSRKKDEATFSALEDIINQLVADKAELVGIANAYESQLVSQRISPTDVEYVTNSLLPLVEQLLGSNEPDGEPNPQFEAFRSVLSVETITVLQLLGFNFREAIGEPLTEIAKNLILGLGKSANKGASTGEVAEMNAVDHGNTGI
jgi:hypothetical protein